MSETGKWTKVGFWNYASFHMSNHYYYWYDVHDDI